MLKPRSVGQEEANHCSDGAKQGMKASAVGDCVAFVAVLSGREVKADRGSGLELMERRGFKIEPTAAQE